MNRRKDRGDLVIVGIKHKRESLYPFFWARPMEID